ncbi:MAG: tRNA lysidine(34) synthetase TilS [Candidatus Marinimicrobia bacterium]|nr:tRNA lysidine(34) synthetase TilS [Candidatus Neomarinimicrobiota bacterium]
MKKLYSRFKNIIDKHQLISDRDRIIAAISGGVDSIALLHLLFKLMHEAEISFELQAAHLNHSTRDGASDKDQALVEGTCQKYAIPLETKKVDVHKKAQQSNLSFEMMARKVRYDFFQKIAGNGTIATGHTLDDHIETILLRVIKGTGLNGLGGIEYKTDNIIHPLRFATKDELYSYAAEEQLNFNEDSTNFENKCDRNVIRNIIIPTINQKINPNFIDAVDRLSQISSEVNNFINQRAIKKISNLTNDRASWYYALDHKKFESLHIALLKHIILEISNRLIPHSTIDFSSFEQIVEQLSHKNRGQIIKLNSDLYANFDRDHLIIYNSKAQNWNETAIEINQTFKTQTFKFSTQLVGKEGNKSPSPNVEYIDYDKIKGDLKLRHWKYGDKFKPLNFNHRKKVSDYFIDNKIPKFKKHFIPILESDNRIVWICGQRLSDEFKLENHSKNILKLIYSEK